MEGSEIMPSSEGSNVTQPQQRDLGGDTEAGRVHLAAVVDSAGDAILSKSLEGTILSWNKGAERLYGYTAAEVVGRPISMLVPEERAGEVPRFLDQIKRGQSIDHYETVRVTKAGNHLPVSLTISPIHDADGNILGASTIARNITSFKETERGRAHLAAVVDSADDAILSKTLEGTILSWNKAAERLYGYTAVEVVGRPISMLVPEERAGEVPRFLDQIKRGQSIDHYETVRVTKAGNHQPVSLTISPIHDADGNILGASTIARDIRLRKEAEELTNTVRELHRSNEELAQFAYIASHDLQEPLRMVVSYMELLSRRYKGKLDSEADEFIAFAVDGASRMQRLIQDLLAYSRVASKGRDPLDASSEQALQWALDNLHGAIEQSGAKVTHDPLPTVLADKAQLTQLFQNLIGNAIKYRSSAVPQVHISAAKDQTNNWTFSVQDNGLGIDPQYFDRIFGMFQRLHNREEFAGTGIGLAVCKKIVERHGGTISVESQPGQGSTFRFDLVESGKRL